MQVSLMGVLLGFVVCAVGFVLPAQADTIYFSVKGAKLGQLKGEAPQPNLQDKMIGLKFLHEVTSPRDVATGQARAARQHKPLVITKEWGAASPQLFQALVNNEVLTEVLIDFVGHDQNGQERLTHRIRLTNAAITNILYRMEEGAGAAAGSAKHLSASGPRHLEDISFIFQRIEMEDLIGKTMAVDDIRAK
jgi:type VI secretion system secreted protein Hcp